jgi:hypothetical protein
MSFTISAKSPRLRVTILHPTKCQADVTHFHVPRAASMPRHFLCGLVVLLTEIRELLSQAWPSTNPPFAIVKELGNDVNKDCGSENGDCARLEATFGLRPQDQCSGGAESPRYQKFEDNQHGTAIDYASRCRYSSSDPTAS